MIWLFCWSLVALILFFITMHHNWPEKDKLVICSATFLLCLTWFILLGFAILGLILEDIDSVINEVFYKDEERESE